MDLANCYQKSIKVRERRVRKELLVIFILFFFFLIMLNICRWRSNSNAAKINIRSKKYIKKFRNVEKRRIVEKGRKEVINN